jgi:hypothetical protein
LRRFDVNGYDLSTVKINVNVRFPEIEELRGTLETLVTVAREIVAGHHMSVQLMGVYHNGLIERLTRMEELLSNTASPIPQLISDLRAQVEANTQVDLAAIQLLNGLSEKLNLALRSGDIEQLRSFAVEMERSKNELAAAITKNTPADPGAGGTTEGGTTEGGAPPEPVST